MAILTGSKLPKKELGLDGRTIPFEIVLEIYCEIHLQQGGQSLSE
jgi:hypothetical protein